MGGNALSVPSIRLDKFEYEDLSRRIRNGFHESLQIIPSYRNKPTFGDMDVLYKNDDEFYDLSNIAFTEDILKKFCGLTVKEHFKNGNIVSYGVELPQGIFQLDFIGVQSKYFDFALNYFSYNDMGNLLGRVAHGMGVKLSFEGLRYIQRDEKGRVLHEHVLTVDWNKALEFMGYDSERYEQGFDDLQDIFNYVVLNENYSFEYYKLSQRNYEARIRDRKRASYRAFLEWVEAHRMYGNLPLPKEAYISYTFDEFPSFEMDYNVIRAQAELKRKAVLWYNGYIVSNVTGLIGKELGIFMGYLKPKMTDAYVVANQLSIQEIIRSEYKLYRMNHHVD